MPLMTRGLATGREMHSRLGVQNHLQTIRALHSTRKASLWRRRARSRRWDLWSCGSNRAKEGEAAGNLAPRVGTPKLVLGRDLGGGGEASHVQTIVAGHEDTMGRNAGKYW